MYLLLQSGSSANHQVVSTKSIGRKEEQNRALLLVAAPSHESGWNLATQTMITSEHTDDAAYVICECGTSEHQFHISYNSKDGDFYLTAHLESTRFWKRLWRGIKYIFGYKSRYGEFGEILMTPVMAHQLGNWLLARGISSHVITTQSPPGSYKQQMDQLVKDLNHYANAIATVEYEEDEGM